MHLIIAFRWLLSVHHVYLADTLPFYQAFNLLFFFTQNSRRAIFIQGYKMLKFHEILPFF